MMYFVPYGVSFTSTTFFGPCDLKELAFQITYIIPTESIVRKKTASICLPHEFQE